MSSEASGRHVDVADGPGQTLGEFGYGCGEAVGMLRDGADRSRRPRRIRPPDGFPAFSLWFSVSSVVDPRLFLFTTENTEGHREGTARGQACCAVTIRGRGCVRVRVLRNGARRRQRLRYELAAPGSGDRAVQGHRGSADRFHGKARPLPRPHPAMQVMDFAESGGPQPAYHQAAAEPARAVDQDRSVRVEFRPQPVAASRFPERPMDRSRDDSGSCLRPAPDVQDLQSRRLLDQPRRFRRRPVAAAVPEQGQVPERFGGGSQENRPRQAQPEPKNPPVAFPRALHVAPKPGRASRSTGHKSH